MIRRIVLTTFTLMACTAGLMSGRVSAAPPTTCTLTPIPDSEDAEGGFANRQYRFMAMWMATADCEDPNHPLDGETVDIQQMAAVSPHGGGSVGGPTRLSFTRHDSDSLGPDYREFGEVRGPAACNATMCTLSLDIRASGDGSRFHGSEMLTFDRGTGEVQIFLGGDGILEDA